MVANDTWVRVSIGNRSWRERVVGEAVELKRGVKPFLEKNWVSVHSAGDFLLGFNLAGSSKVREKLSDCEPTENRKRIGNPIDYIRVSAVASPRSTVCWPSSWTGWSALLGQTKRKEALGREFWGPKKAAIEKQATAEPQPPRRRSPGHALIEFVVRLRLGEGVARKSRFIEKDGLGVVFFP